MASPDISTSRTDTLWLNQMLDCIIYSARTDIGRFFATSLDDLMPISKLTNADDYRRYPVFAPDDIVHRISGLIPPAKDAGTDTLEAFGDGSFFGYRYKVLEQHGVTAVGGYGTFLQAGYYTAEYGFGMLDSKHVLDISGFEFLAAIVAMKVAIDGGYKKLIIHHDSRIVNPDVFNSQQSKKRSKIVKQYLAFCKMASKLVDIEYVKVKAHNGSIGNEHANMLAQVSAQNIGFALRDCIASVSNAETFAETFETTASRSQMYDDDDYENGDVKGGKAYASYRKKWDDVADSDDDAPKLNVDESSTFVSDDLIDYLGGDSMTPDNLPESVVAANEAAVNGNGGNGQQHNANGTSQTQANNGNGNGDNTRQNGDAASNAASAERPASKFRIIQDADGNMYQINLETNVITPVAPVASAIEQQQDTDTDDFDGYDDGNDDADDVISDDTSDDVADDNALNQPHKVLVGRGQRTANIDDDSAATRTEDVVVPTVAIDLGGTSRNSDNAPSDSATEHKPGSSSTPNAKTNDAGVKRTPQVHRPTPQRSTANSNGNANKSNSANRVPQSRNQQQRDRQKAARANASTNSGKKDRWSTDDIRHDLKSLTLTTSSFSSLIGDYARSIIPQDGDPYAWKAEAVHIVEVLSTYDVKDTYGLTDVQMDTLDRITRSIGLPSYWIKGHMDRMHDLDVAFFGTTDDADGAAIAKRIVDRICKAARNSGHGLAKRLPLHRWISIVDGVNANPMAYAYGSLASTVASGEYDEDAYVPSGTSGEANIIAVARHMSVRGKTLKACLKGLVPHIRERIEQYELDRAVEKNLETFVPSLKQRAEAVMSKDPLQLPYEEYVLRELMDEGHSRKEIASKMMCGVRDVDRYKRRLEKHLSGDADESDGDANNDSDGDE